MKRCPSCSEPLFRRHFADLELDGCRSCGGVWFDEGELGRAAREQPEALRAADLFFQEGQQPSLAPARSDVCPSCGDVLAEGEHPSFPGVSMRMCGQCRGVFLPQGSGAALTVRLTDEPPAPVPVADTSPKARAHDPTSTRHLPIVRGAFVERDVVHETGLFASFDRALTFMRATYRLTREQPRLLLPVSIGAGINLVLVVVMALTLALLVPLGRGEESARVLDEMMPLLVGVFVVISFVGHVASWAAMGMTVSAVDAYVKGQPIVIGVAARDVLKNIWAVVVLSVVSMIVEAITSSLRRRRGIFGIFAGLAASAIDALWTTLSFLLLPVVMIEDIGLFAAVARVRDMHRRNLMTIAVGEVGIRLVTGIAGFLVGAAFIGLFTLLQPEGVASWVALIAVSLAAALLFNALALFVRATYYTCLYLWAAAAEAAPDAKQLRVPGPLAEAFV